MTTQRARAGLRIPYGLNTDLILIAKDKGISKSALMLDILGEWVENQKQKTKR